MPDALGAASGVLARARAAKPGDPVGFVIGGPGERKPLILDGDWLYTERMRALEERFASRVRQRRARSPGLGEDRRRALGKAVLAIAPGPPPLTKEQRHAVGAALRAPLALVTGGPGTGKTTVVVALLRALAWVGERMDAIAIAAPTGKAAQRLREAIQTDFSSRSRDFAEMGLSRFAPVPQTLHRLLGWSPSRRRFSSHENDPLPHRWVIVDEASMIDLALMDRLLRGLHPDANLTLIGDADQLPSVDAGAVFRDLCAVAAGAPADVVRLTENLRVASSPSARRIVSAARAVNGGALDARSAEAVVTLRAVRELSFEGVEHLAARWDEVGSAVLDAWWRERFGAEGGALRPARGEGSLGGAARTFAAPGHVLRPEHRDEVRALFALHARSRVLCVTRVVGPASAHAVNEGLLDRLRGGREHGAWRRRAAQPSPGTPLVFDRNDYERELFNGDQAIALRVDAGDGPRLMAVFPRGEEFEAVVLDAANDMSLAFAMTVHKAQGSEFDHVLLVLPDADMPLLSRELVYTAITRAKRSVLIVGPEGLLARAVARTAERDSGLGERLRGSDS
jgi:exodeoxyribonuclease V alpha subunit